MRSSVLLGMLGAAVRYSFVGEPLLARQPAVARRAAVAPSMVAEVPAAGRREALASAAAAAALLLGGSPLPAVASGGATAGKYTTIPIAKRRYFGRVKQGVFEFHAGPVFANIVLADEINRASPKTQAALLEVMEEGHVTIDGVTRPVGDPFLVLATQNPVEQAGTYRLPEAQLDRFMMRTSLGYPDHAATVRILDGAAAPIADLAPVVTPDALVGMTDLATGVYVDALVLDYIARIVDATRSADEVRLGVSIRGALALTRAVRARAAAQGRTYVTPDDVKALVVPVLSHRLILQAEAEFDGVTQEAVVGQVLLDIAPPTRREVE